VCEKLIKNSQPFGKKFQKTVGGDFFDSHCTAIVHHTLTMRPLYRAKTITIKLDNFKHFAETIQ